MNTTHTPGFLAWLENLTMRQLEIDYKLGATVALEFCKLKEVYGLQAFSALIPVDIQIEMCNNYAWIHRAAAATVPIKENSTMLKVEREMQTVFIPVKQAIAAPYMLEALVLANQTFNDHFGITDNDEAGNHAHDEIRETIKEATA